MERRIVDVFLQDRLVASYPVVLDDRRRPRSDRDFVDHIKRHLRRTGSAFDLSAAKFIVRRSGE
jgi:hypothetical protein